MITGFTPRLYQEKILATAAEKNTLVVLPTGMGKTNIFLMLAAIRLQRFPNSKILFIGPTKPLIDQYYKVFVEHFEIDKDKLAVFTGLVSPVKRAQMWKTAQIFFSTPQGLENDIISKRISLEDVSLLGIDEAHRAVGDYSYVWIAKQYHQMAKFPHIIALTASPGSELERITEVCKNLAIEEIEFRSAEDPDVKPYVQEVDIEHVKVDLPDDFVRVKQFLERSIKSKLVQVKKFGYVRGVLLTRTELLRLQGQLQAKLAKGEKDFPILKSISLVAEVMKVYHALELVETQGIAALYAYMQKLESDAEAGTSKAVKNLMNDPEFRSARIITTRLYEDKVEHPKIAKVVELLKEQLKGDSKALIFTQYRDSAASIHNALNEAGYTSSVFVGQAKRGTSGLSQKEQKAMLDDFRAGGFNVLIATSIGEEGLDIPKVDLVLFYEPVPSGIRQIQRRGRTGRAGKGKVVILITRNTRDETFQYVSQNRERKMHRLLHDLKSKMQLQSKPQKTLASYEKKDKVKIIVDNREKGNNVVKKLVELGADVSLQTLPIGDFLCSNRVAVEFKTVEDFVNSLIDGRLLEQMRAMKYGHDRPLLLVEGQRSIYTVRNVHPNAIRGMLAAIAIGYGVPILYAQDSNDAAELLLTIAKREQTGDKDWAVHGEKKQLTLAEQQEYIVSGLPGIERTLAESLLKEFGSVAKVMAASEEELQKARLIGEKKAREIRRVLDADYANVDKRRL